jgi:hypothetical protein
MRFVIGCKQKSSETKIINRESLLKSKSLKASTGSIFRGLEIKPYDNAIIA